MKRGTPKHPKVYALAALLKCRRPTAIGYLEMLWHMTADYTPQGNIGKYSDAWIEASLDWGGRKGFLVECLIKTGWLDYEDLNTPNPLVYEGLNMSDPLPTHSEWAQHRKLFVHDWHDHADSAVSKRLGRLGLSFLKITDKVTEENQSVTGQRQPSRAPGPATSQPEPLPEPPPAAQSARGGLAGHIEFPDTAAAVREKFPEAEDRFVTSLTLAVAHKTADANGKLRGSPTDQLIAEAVRHCSRASPNQNSAGLYLKTVPQCVTTWLMQGRPSDTPKSENPVWNPKNFQEPPREK